MADELTIKVVSGSSESLHLHVDLSTASVFSLKQLIEQQDARRFPIPAQRLIFQGQILQDGKALSDYHVAAGCALHLTLTPGAVAAANAAAATASGPAAPIQLRSYLQQMREYESQDQYATAVRTLQKICANIVGNPAEDKYRKLRVDNAALKAKLFDRTRGQDCVKLLGFQDGAQDGFLVLVPTPEKWESLVTCKTVVDSAVSALGGNTAMGASPFGAATGASPFSGAPPMGGMGGDFTSQAQALLQNPAMLQAMTNNPMVQQMAQQNPMMAQALQNPALLAQSVQALQQNPAMMQQMNQMMSDPNAMARMQQMMAGGGMGGSGGLGGLGSTPFGATAPTSSAAANPFASGASAANPFAKPATVDSAIAKSSVSSVSPASGSSSGVQAFAPLAFDESLVAALGNAVDAQLPTSSGGNTGDQSTSTLGSKSAADFFLDQIAAVVADEKKLSDITGLAPDTPAANSGICVGDTLVAVSGLPVRGLQFSTVIGRLKSTSRNSVVLKLRRNPCTS
ncbi:hypothetical protein JM16_007872 [Phytophthora kernoviae]|uniref:Ubiquitin-like domain-containing protein n=1 Tax=Phytophthora kernoviae TaxID=325452 RepID=A0A8T0LNC0_9STRA|nr:hypothetical protein JM16_007872 [Phytophthora kernoviae]